MSLKTIKPIDDTDQIPGMEMDNAIAIRSNEPPEPSQRDSAQARVDAVASLLHKAYDKASTLALTPEEIAALTASFVDADFRTGAAGKENLIYIEHASLRERLNKVIGVGQWSLVARNRWTETFTTGRNEEAHRVYVEAVLLIRGCFVAEAVGDMVYYPKNQQINFGDAVEGAKSAALRRCAKELGVGLQAWHKDFCDGWFQRRGEINLIKARSEGPPNLPKTPSAAPQPVKAPETPEQRRERFLGLFRPFGDTFNGMLLAEGLILGSETMEDLHDDQIAMITKKQVNDWLMRLPDDHGTTTFQPESEDRNEYVVQPTADEPWRNLVTPFTLKEVPAGTPLGELDKKALWFWVMCWQPKPYTSPKNGKTYPPKDEDIILHTMLQLHKPAIVAKYQFKEPKPL